VAVSVRKMWRPVSPRPRRAPASHQSGELLVETMMTVAIMGISFIAVFGAVFTAIRIADKTEKTSKADAVVRAYAEAMKKPDGDATYQPCTTAGSTVTYPAWPSPSQYANYQTSVVKIRYLSGYYGGVPLWSNTCTATDLGAQELTLSATGPTNQAAVQGTEQVVITKRDARADL
jgi:type II secretory pathway pseudopilin PulG